MRFAMTIRHLPLLAGSLLSSIFLLSSPVCAAEMPPEKPVGLTGLNDVVGTIDLAPHNLGAVGDYELRARSIVVAPSGAIHNHPHAGRPGVVRIIKGTLIEVRGTTERTLKAGDSWYEYADTVHWFRNPSSSEPAEIWAVDMVPKKK